MCTMKKVDPHRIQRLVTMWCDTLRIKRWERPNLMCNVVEKTFEGKQKKRMIGWANNQVFAPSPAHDLKHT
jgi:hypothetical protein